MAKRKLFARDGMIYTNGTVYGKQISLAEGESGENWHEITEEEYQEILKEQEGNYEY